MATATWTANTTAKSSAAPLDGTEELRVNDSGTSKKATTGNIKDYILGLVNTWTAQNTFAAGAITTSKPLTLTQTWNAGGVTFTGLKENVTDTASASASLLLDLQVGGVSKFSVQKDGSIPTGSALQALTDTWNDAGTVFNAIKLTVTNTASAGGSALINLFVGAGSVFKVDAGGVMETGFGVFNGYVLSGSGSFLARSDSGGYYLGASDDVIVARGTAKILSIEAAGSSGGTIRFIPTTPSQITSNQDNYNPGGSSYFQRWSTDASRNVTGLTFTTAQISGQTHRIVNVGAQDIVLKNNVTSTAANRFQNSTGADITLTAGQSAEAIYDATSAGNFPAWRVYKSN